MDETLTQTEREAWRAFLRVHARVIRIIGRELERSHGLNPSMYDVLVTLYEAPQNRLRMSDLAEQLVLTPSGLTRVVESLRKLGYVRRRVDPKDRRSVLVTLTPEGRAARLNAQPTVIEVLVNHLLQYLTPEETATLRTAFNRVLDGTRPAGRGGRTAGSPAAAVAAVGRS